MWWLLGVGGVAVLVFAWALCCAASRADESAESFHLWHRLHKGEENE